MHLLAVGRALAEHRYSQCEITGFLAELWRDEPETVARMRRLHENVGVATRHLALPLDAILGLGTFGRCNDAWIDAALRLSERALADALQRAGLTHADIDALFTVSVTGIASPSLDARLCNRVPLRPDLKRIPIFGLGCVAGVAGLARAAEYVRAFPDQVAVLLAVELCSLTFQRDDRSIPHLISSGLFGDGAAAVVVGGAARRAPVGPAAPRVVASQSTLYRDTEQVMGWRISERGFEIVLSADVPRLAREQLGADVDRLLARHALPRARIGSWVCHPGGPKVLRAMQQALDLPDPSLAFAWQTLREQGNLSSASVLMVLREVQDRARPAPGTPGMLLAMGPGFCSECVLVEW
jgi:alkylresorcinol/alkylpyrone synthase